MRKLQQQHPAKFPGFNPNKFFLLEDSGLRSTPPEAIPPAFNVYPQLYDMHPLISPAAMLTVQKVNPADVKDGELVIYRTDGPGRPSWHMGFVEVRAKTVTLAMLTPYGRQVFDRMHYSIGSKPRIREDEIMLKVSQVHSMSYQLTLDRFRGNASLLLLASGIPMAGDHPRRRGKEG